ncbi:MAG: DMT family transporter, partial [Planktomarina sp.]|mgnify:FL=1|nr:DMT family transporter [Planktomarina sp.]|tara:strand:- start:135 stop:998 length:864 start_codon:yes stop_codon:yes gene_type:complete
MDIRAILAGLVFALIWSSAFTSARVIVAEAPPILSLSLRFLISGVIGVGLARLLGQTWRLNRAEWQAIFIFGLCQNALYLGLNFVAMQTIEASLASIIASTMPLLVGLVGWVWFKEKLPIAGVWGLIVGAIGAALIMGVRMQGGTDFFGITLCIVGVLSITVATLSMRGVSSGGNLLMIVGLQMLVGAIILAFPGAVFEEWDVVWTPKLLLAFSYTVLMPGLLATFIWFWLVGRIGAVRAATFHFLNPFFGVLIAALFLGESLGIWDAVGVIVIMTGIFVVQTSRNI